MKIKKTLGLILLTISLFSCQQEKQQNNSTLKNKEIMENQAKQEIENLLNTYKETLNASDAVKATSLYTKDGAFMPSNAPSAIGKEQILDAYEFVFSQIQLSIQFYIDEIHIENEMAFAMTRSKGGTLIHANKTTIPEENRELFVFQKEEGQWKIARYMFNKTK
ncbi:YybH family protein [Flavicella sediminum]|uniref:YybH family protein n=1 Tax=Flavicella sediminum TaxID=2585141 RepID=UPI00111DD6B3|nr:nuclear transport factor 2 family protein [Flavicella sediminum]